MPFRHRARLVRGRRSANLFSGAAVIPTAAALAFGVIAVGGQLGGHGFLGGAGVARAADATVESPSDETPRRPVDPPPIMRAEVGAEYDSNVHRVEVIRGMTAATPVASPVGRLVLGLSSAGRVGRAEDVAFSILGGVKGFERPEARNENVLVLETAGSWRAAVGERTQVAASTVYYEAVQAGTSAERELSGEARDFRSLSPVLRLGRFLGSSPGEGGQAGQAAAPSQPGQLDLALGYRWFTYKPNRAYDFQAPVLGLEYRQQRESDDGEADWELTAGAAVELRRFSGARLVPTPPEMCGTPGDCAPMIDPLGARHVDQFSSGHLELTRTGSLLLGLGYTLQWNRSNSDTESVFRHVGIAKLASALPGHLFLAARAELVYATYPDHVVLAAGPTGSAMASIEDENRSQLRVELSRALLPALRVVARYTLALNAFGQSVLEYRRQTATLSLSFSSRE
jgi:hypothetical protein